MDPRIEKLADVLLNYSIKLKKGKLVKIKGELVALPLMRALYKKALDLGAHPYVQFSDPSLDEYFFKNATPTQMRTMPAMRGSESVSSSNSHEARMTKT